MNRWLDNEMWQSKSRLSVDVRPSQTKLREREQETVMITNETKLMAIK
jgi:hypothetical protein